MPMRRAKGKIKYINTPKYKMWAIPSFCSTSLSYNTVTVLFFNLEKKNQLILLRKKKPSQQRLDKERSTPTTFPEFNRGLRWCQV